MSKIVVCFQCNLVNYLAPAPKPSEIRMKEEKKSYKPTRRKMTKEEKQQMKNTNKSLAHGTQIESSNTEV